MMLQQREKINIFSKEYSRRFKDFLKLNNYRTPDMAYRQWHNGKYDDSTGNPEEDAKEFLVLCEQEYKDIG